MRSEKEMFALLISTAEKTKIYWRHIWKAPGQFRGVSKDIFQDYDLVYVVKETRPFIENREWIDRFGKRLYMQYPEEGFLG